MDGRTNEQGDTFKDEYMRAYMAKNRMGKEREVLLDWRPQEGILEEMTPDDLSWYEANIEPLEKSVMQVRQGKKFGEK